MSSKNSTKKQQAQTTKNTASLAKASAIDLTKSLTALSSTGVNIQSALSKISEELITKHAELQAVDDAIALKKQEMTTLHGVDQVLLTIDEVRAQHATTVEQLAKEKLEIETANQELQQQRNTDRQRDEEAFNYKLLQTRKADQDSWNEQVRARQNQERDRQEAFEKNVFSREEVLRLKETQYQDAIVKAANFDIEVKKEVDKQVSIITNSMKKDHQHQTEISTIQHTSALDKLQFDNKRLVEAANNLETQLKTSQEQLKEAYAANAALAAKAVEGASNKQAQADALALVTNIGGGNGQARPRS